MRSCPKNPAVTVEAVPDNKFNEAMVIVRSSGNTRTTVLFADVIQNNPPETKFMFRLLGFYAAGVLV